MTFKPVLGRNARRRNRRLARKTADRLGVKPARVLACARNVRYASFARAVVEADRVRRATNRELGVYACPVCDGWHLTGRGAR